jgi:hypothetical protein
LGRRALPLGISLVVPKDSGGYKVIVATLLAHGNGFEHRQIQVMADRAKNENAGPIRQASRGSWFVCPFHFRRGGVLCVGI